MYSIDEIKELITALDNSSLTDLEITGKAGEKISFKKKITKCITSDVTTVNPVSVQSVNSNDVQNTDKSTQQQGKTINCPMVGVFYTSSSPDAEPYVKAGSKVNKGDVVCIIEAMKLMNEVVSTECGTITEVLVENGDLVEYGQPLFVIE